MGASGAGGPGERRYAHTRGVEMRINRRGDDLHIETQSVAPPDSRVELISNTETDWNTLQTALLKLRLATHA